MVQQFSNENIYTPQQVEGFSLLEKYFEATDEAQQNFYTTHTITDVPIFASAVALVEQLSAELGLEEKQILQLLQGVEVTKRANIDVEPEIEPESSTSPQESILIGLSYLEHYSAENYDEITYIENHMGSFELNVALTSALLIMTNTLSKFLGTENSETIKGIRELVLGGKLG